MYYLSIIAVKNHIAVALIAVNYVIDEDGEAKKTSDAS